jgi:tetratricopeptide (TPR) repeat protein
MAKKPDRYRAMLTAAALAGAVGAVLLGPAASPTEAASGDTAELLRQAAEQLSVFNWDPAHRLYEQVLESSPEGSAPWQEATFGAAVCVHHVSPSGSDNIAKAGKLYRSLAEPALKSRFAARSLMNLGRMAELKDYDADIIDLNTAKERYTEVIERFPTDPIASEATLRLAGAHVQTFEHDQILQGIGILEAWIASHPNDPLASAMWQYVGDAYFFLRDYRPSLNAYVKCDQIGWTDIGNQGPLYWRMAIMADKYLNDRKTAAIYYTKIIIETPYSGKAFESQLALKAMGLPVPEIKIFRSSATTAPITSAKPDSENPGGIDGH